MELETQQYLRSGKTLEGLGVEYGIKANISDPLGVVSLNYGQFSSDMTQLICCECRALILELNTWEVVSRSFFKFFNHGQPEADQIDWSTAEVQEKLDGSLICFYYYKGAWQVATKGTADASGPVGESNFTFRDLVNRTIEARFGNRAAFEDLLSPEVFYTFELTSPHNRVVIPYTEDKLTLLSAWDANTLEEIGPSWTGFQGFERPCTYPVHTLEQTIEAAKSIGNFELEGYVVKDADNNRIKIKSPAYLIADKAIQHIGTERGKLELILSDSYDDIYPTLPDFAQAILIECNDRLKQLMHNVHGAYLQIKDAPTRKEFAQAALKYRYSGLLFAMLDGKNVEDAIKLTHVPTIVDFMQD